MINTFRDLPKKVLSALGVILAAIIIIGVSVPFLGGARDEAVSENGRLTGEIARLNAAINQSKVDQDYVKANGAEYEALIKSDRLVPHSGRVAVVALENEARAAGLTDIGFTIDAAEGATSLRAVANQPTSGAYVLSVQEIDISAVAPLDGQLYRFLDALRLSFPGSAVLEAATFKRGDVFADGVSGKFTVSWRTAQAQEKK